MSTPMAASKTTISSRNKVAHSSTSQPQAPLSHQSATQTNLNNISRKTALSAMRPPNQTTFNQYSSNYNNTNNNNHHNNNKQQTVTATSAPMTKIASLANGMPRVLKEIDSNEVPTRHSSMLAAPRTVGPKLNARSNASTLLDKPNNRSTANKISSSYASSRLPPLTVAKLNTKQQLMDLVNTTSKGTLPANQSRLIAPQTRLSGVPMPLNSRSSSIVSSISSSTTATNNNNNNNMSRIRQINVSKSTLGDTHHIPETNTVRKGLAKFSNPIECQRQFQALSLKKRKLDEIIEARENEIDTLQEQLKQAINIGVGYATVVQYFAMKLKIGSKIDLMKESEELRRRVEELLVNEENYEHKLKVVVDDYKNQLQAERDLKFSVEQELDETRRNHSEYLDELRKTHKQELDDLISKHSDVETQLNNRIELLESELETKSKDLTSVRKDYETLNDNFSKLEDTLTKDKDARMKYAQEKISQLQKDVDSLNSVLEMRSEKIHALEKDNLLLAEIQTELSTLKDANKALNQQLESMNATLERKREQYENLFVEHEKVRQELKNERKERRRMTMRTEQLEYVLNESCASESNMVFNSSF